jgi:hypothetical protein
MAFLGDGGNACPNCLENKAYRRKRLTFVAPPSSSKW